MKWVPHPSAALSRKDGTPRSLAVCSLPEPAPKRKKTLKNDQNCAVFTLFVCFQQGLLQIFVRL
jgi:hypothetical protein